MATAMASATGASGELMFALLLVIGIPIVTIISMVVFWRNEKKKKEVWIIASLIPWIYLLC